MAGRVIFFLMPSNPSIPVPKSRKAAGMGTGVSDSIACRGFPDPSVMEILERVKIP